MIRKQPELTRSLSRWTCRTRPPARPPAPPARRPDPFYTCTAWRDLRASIIEQQGTICRICGIDAQPIHVDHILPRAHFPALALSPENLQILCQPCNFRKGTRYVSSSRPA